MPPTMPADTDALLEIRDRVTSAEAEIRGLRQAMRRIEELQQASIQILETMARVETSLAETRDAFGRVWSAIERHDRELDTMRGQLRDTRVTVGGWTHLAWLTASAWLGAAFMYLFGAGYG